MRGLRVAASLWSVPRHATGSEAARLAAAGISRLHWDAADGTIGPAGGFGAEEAARLGAATGTVGEAHLMTTDPLPVLDAWLVCCDTVAVHRQAPDWREAVRRIRDAGAAPAVAITAGTELAGLDRSIGVLVMSVRPGHAGSGFDPAAIGLVREARALGHGLIGVDGSVTAELGRELAAAGAGWLVSGTSLTAAADPAAWLRTAGAD